MNEWKEKPLSDLAILYNDSWKVGDEECPYIALEHIEEGKLRLSGIGYSDSVASNKYRFNEKNFLFGKLRPYFRKVVRPQFSGICSTDIWVVGARGETDLIFLFYLFANQEFVDLAYSGSSGTRMPRADWKFMKDTVWLIPSDIKEQRAIASVLSSLDDKIDLLHRQNKTLEAMAETLFRQWFVEEADEGWEEKALKEICVINNGYAFKSPTYQDYGQKIIRTLNFSTHWIKLDRLVFISQELAKLFEKYYLKRNDFLLVMVGASLGNFSIVTKDVLPALQNQNMWCFRAKKNLKQHYLNFALRKLIDENLHGASGSARQFFQKSVFYEIEVSIPPLATMKEFEEVTEGYFQKIELNRSQIRTLEKLRDTLLPKLISGDVRVKLEQQEADI